MKSNLKILKNFNFFAPAFILSIPLVWLSSENLGRSLVVLIFIWSWLFLGRKLKSYTLVSFLLILFILPFNITIQLPQLADPYVGGVIVNYLIPTISVLDLGFFLLLYSAYQEEYVKKYLTKLSPLFLFVAMYIVFHNLMFFNWITLFTTLRYILYIVTAYTVFRYFRNLRSKKKIWEYIVWILLATTLFQGLLGIFQMAFGAGLGLSILGESNIISGVLGSSFVELGGSQYLRAYGTFPHPNVLSGFLLFAAIIGSVYLLNNKEKGLKGFLLLAHSSLFVLFTFSRVSIFLFALLWILIIFIWFKYSKKKLNAFIPPLIFERFTNIFTKGDFAVADRVKLNESAIQIIKDKWYSGVGLGEFVRGLEGNIPLTTAGMSLLQPVHNIPLLILAEHGVLFGGIMLVGLIYGAYGWFKDVRKEYKLIAGFVLVSLVLTGMFDHYLFTLPQGNVLLLLLLGLLTL